MILTELKVHHLRNIQSAHLVLNPRFNFISGANGSGKTSLLESFYLLSCGHSFRSREISPIISHGHSSLTVFARSQDQGTVSIQKSNLEPTQIKINNQYCQSTSQLAYALPCQVFYSDIFQIIDAGPSVRRSLLDWGLFHVKPNYLSLLKEYKKVLKHRNALLKRHAPQSHFVPWDLQLDTLANQLNALREEYFQRWVLEFTNTLSQLSDISCSITYCKGWDRKNTGKTLEQVLTEHFTSDQQKTYTQYGAHQADILIEANQTKAKNVLSRGQQKIILFALKLAQAKLLDQDCLYLIDDLAAELDVKHQRKLLDLLQHSKGQYVITGTESLDAIFSTVNDDYQRYTIDNGILAAT